MGVLVTGATGTVGSVVVSQLVAAGLDVYEVVAEDVLTGETHG
jgi:nucleoside-diphosphate-sugar epimerase